MEYSRTKKVFLNALGGIAARAFSIISAFLTRTIFIMVLGIQYAGVSSVFTDILVVLSFAELGIGSAITYALYKPIADNDEKQICKYMNTYKLIYRVIAIVVVVAGIIIAPFLEYIIKNAPDIKENLRLIFLFYIINTASSYLMVYKGAFLTAAQKDYIVSKSKIIIAVLRTIIECVTLIVFRNFIVYLTIGIGINILQNYYIAKVAEKEYPVIKRSSKEKLTKAETKRLFSDVRALALYKVSSTVLNGTDSVITSSIFGATTVGVLGNYTLISNQLYNFMMQVFTATSASIGNYAVYNEKEAQYQVFKKMNFICFWLYIMCSTCLWTLFNRFMHIWQGENRVFSSVMVAAIVGEFFIKGMLSPVSQFRTANGLFIQGKYRPVIMAVLNIVISIVLANNIGVVGIILGTIISRALTQLWYDPMLIYESIFKRNVLKYYAEYCLNIGMLILSCGISQGLTYLICPKNSIISLVVGAITAVIISNTIVLLIYSKSEEFKESIILIKRVVKRKL